MPLVMLVILVIALMPLVLSLMPLALAVILVIALMGISLALLVFQLTVPVESLHNPYTGTPSW